MDMHYPYQLPPLPYAYEALSPNISGDTLHFHHDKHFQTYVDNLNTALAWWVSGIPFDLLHCAGNFAMALVLFRPCRQVLTRLMRT